MRRLRSRITPGLVFAAHHEDRASTDISWHNAPSGAAGKTKEERGRLGAADRRRCMVRVQRLTQREQQGPGIAQEETERAEHSKEHSGYGTNEVFLMLQRHCA